MSHVLLVKEQTGLAVPDSKSRSQVLRKIAYVYLAMKSYSCIHTLEKFFYRSMKDCTEIFSTVLLVRVKPPKCS